MGHRTSRILMALAAVGVPATAMADIPVASSEKVGISVGGLGQMLGLAQEVDDPYQANGRVYLFLKEARLRAAGHYEDYTFNLELGLGSEDSVAAPNPGVALGLLDFSVNVPLHLLGKSYVTLGQFKVPYGREQLTYSGFSDFGDRSIDYLGFKVGRDVGAALTLKQGLATVIAGVSTGGGRDVPPYHYLPEKLGIPLVALRAGVGDLKDQDEYHLRQSDATEDKPRYAFFVNGLFTKDTRIGHSTVLNVKEADKSLLLDSNWNPYIAQTPFAQGDWWQTGADAAVRAPLGGQTAFSGEVELNYGGYSNGYGALQMVGVRSQVALDHRPFELAFRYAIVLPSDRFAANSVPVTGSQAIHELTPAATWFIHGDNLKIVADLPLLLHAPVITEKDVGSYVSTELPDQTALLGKTGTVGRQNVVEGRLMLQALF